MEPSKEVPAATQPVVNRATRIMPVEKPALTLQMDSATPKISGEPGTTCLCTCPHYLSFSERGANQPMDSTTTNPPHWSGDMYQEQLNRPTTHWCQPSPPPPPPHPTPPLLTTCPLLQVASAIQGPMGPRTSTPPHCNHTLRTFGTNQ